MARFECLALETGLSCCASVMDQGAEGHSTPCVVRNGLGNEGAEGALGLILGLILHRLASPYIWSCSDLVQKLNQRNSGFPSRASFHLVSFPEPGHGIRKVQACSQEQERDGATFRMV